MKKTLAVLILMVAVALTAAPTFAGDKIDPAPLFFGDGFDNTTCADMPRCR